MTAADVYYYLCFVIKGSEELAIGFPVSGTARGLDQLDSPRQLSMHQRLTLPSPFTLAPNI